MKSGKLYCIFNVSYCNVSELERKISVRTTREELIERGVLKEIDENVQPATIKEEEGDTQPLGKNLFAHNHFTCFEVKTLVYSEWA